MGKRGLTDVGITKLKAPKGGQVEYFDSPFHGLKGSLALRITAKGTKSFVVFYRLDGKLRRDTLNGRYPGMSLAKARKEVREILELANAGYDPRLAKKRQEAEAKQTNADTYANAVEDFIKKHAIAKRGNRRWHDQQQLLLNADKEWHGRPVTRISRRDITDALDRRMEAGTPYVANRTHAALRTLFLWLNSRDRIIENPMDKIQRPFDREKPRTRVWSDEELKAIWTTDDEVDGLVASYLRLLILMGQRRDEIAGMRWDQLDLNEATWLLPAPQHKTGDKTNEDHLFPLPQLAIRILKGLLRVDDNLFVFPGCGTRDGRANSMTVGTKIKKRIQKASGVPDFTFHDARRTFRTGLDKLKILPHIKDECLNHARQGVGDRHYSHYDYLDEQREAFEMWANHIESLVYPDGVVGLHG